MGYSIRRQGDTDTYGLIEFCCDKTSDIDVLPSNCAPGSACLVIETGDIYILNSEKVWSKL